MSFRYTSRRIQLQRLRSLQQPRLAGERWGVNTQWTPCRRVASTPTAERVLFPGALNSDFTKTMEFMIPAQAQAIPTYRVMNQYGEIIDKEVGVETSDEEALSLYKNMVKCQSRC